MSAYDFDLFVIGAGSGGVRASRMASGFGARVAVAEDTFLGGTCVNVGCVPKKLFVYGSHVPEEVEAAAGYGWSVAKPEFDWPTLRDNKTKEIQRLNGIYGNILANAGVELIEGRATIVDPNTVAVNGKQYTAERILIATGGWPKIPEIPGAEHIISSNEAFYLEEFPKRVMVLGGGYIAVEFAGIFNGLGADTELVYRGPLFLRGFDQEVREFTANEVAQKGVKLTFDTNIESVEKQANGELKVRLTDGSERIVDCVMAATGRAPKIDGLGLENTAVKLTESGTLAVNDDYQTDEPSIYAIGDVVGRMELTPVALAEGMALAKTLYNNQPTRVDYENIATAVFCQPNISTVGLTEEQALEKGMRLRIYTTSFKHMKHTLSGMPERTFMKLLVEDSSDKVVGCHMVGQDAGEIIQGIAVAMKAGATKADFDSTIGIHPTAAEEFVTMRDVTRVVG
ncbi:glutathione-disulfide reductase [Aestuariicella sp. G3-2]|uniref:glutathione-disulfide reductase n=1 Tax=Pseudomaricurvus albidus TaxID=2842452 RepID=UPI001C0B30FF|nr:glutathione-disulfide reductase [Aestuariicella albida]MBU3070511.1 glutathione-disulfide reductase [Aestuariicella albida]